MRANDTLMTRLAAGLTLAIYVSPALAQNEAPAAPPEPAPPPPAAPEAAAEPAAAPEAPEAAAAPEAAPTENAGPAPALTKAATEPAPAVPEPKKDDFLDPKFNVGVGLRVQYSFLPDVPGQNFAQLMGTNIRPYISGQVNDHIKFEANLDSAFATAVSPAELAVDPATGNVVDADGDGTIEGTTIATVRVLDAVIKFELNDFANFWVGRFLPPTDRPNLSGPYYQNAWNYPVQANLYPAIYAGRHDGAAYWGQIGGGQFKWQLGMFDVTGGDNPLFAGKLVLNLLDPEPSYYNSSTYYGEKDILALGAVVQYQKNGDTAAGTGIDGTAFNVEALFEKELSGSGTFTAEAEYYDFKDTDQGQSVVGLLSYLLPYRMGIGFLQPMARLQYRIAQGSDDFAAIDGGLNYIVNGHKARFALDYQHVTARDGLDADNVITLGGQLQF